MNGHRLSENHPLLADPDKPWPWIVLVGYRKAGNRKVVDRRAIFIRAAGESHARAGAIRQARLMPMTKNGERLICSRVVNSRPLDKGDAINAGAV